MLSSLSLSLIFLIEILILLLQAAQASSRVQKWGGKGTDEEVIKPLLE
jgi:hypothetical protein